MLKRFSARKLSKREKQEERAFYLFISLWLLGFIAFTGGPTIASFFISFTNWTGVKTIEFIGLGNYSDMFKDKLFWITLKNTTYYALASVFFGTAVALLIALLLNQDIPGRNFLRTIFFMPSVTQGVAIAIMWLWILNPQVGLLNYGLSFLGIKGPGWVTSQNWAMPALIIMAVWQNGQTMIILLAALQGVPRMFYEAASLDGAGQWAKFRHVTIPMISPALFFVLVLGVVGSFQIFTTVAVMTQGGPGSATLVYVYYLFQNAFSYFKMGYASALGWVLFIIVAALTWVQFVAGRRWVHYE
jgi:multiple sugar transport system permease protein